MFLRFMQTVIIASIFFMFGCVFFAHALDDEVDDPKDDAKLSTDDPDQGLEKDNFKNYGMFSLLDKLDHSVREIDAVVGVISKYRNLEIMLISCWDSNKRDNNYKALVKIWDDGKLMFYGWMFSNSPSLSTMEHQKYYMQLSQCSENQW